MDFLVLKDTEEIVDPKPEKPTNPENKPEGDDKDQSSNESKDDKLPTTGVTQNYMGITMFILGLTILYILKKKRA